MTTVADHKPYSRMTDLPADEVITRYRSGCTLKQLAAAYGTSDNTVKRLLQRHGVPLRTASQAARLNAQSSDPELGARDRQIVEAYNAGASTVTIGKRYGLGSSSVRNILLRNGVTMRTRSAAANLDQPSPHVHDSDLPSEKIILEYTSGTSAATLAEAYDVTSATILWILRRHGVEVRTRQHLPAEEVIDRYQQGDNLSTLAHRYGVSTGMIHRFLEAHGVERRSSAPQAGVPRVVSPETEAEILRRNREGESLRSIATSLGVSRAAVRNVLDRQSVQPSGPKRGPRPDLPMAEIARRHSSGETAKELAAAYGVSAATIRRRLQGMRGQT